MDVDGAFSDLLPAALPRRRQAAAPLLHCAPAASQRLRRGGAAGAALALSARKNYAKSRNRIRFRRRELQRFRYVLRATLKSSRRKPGA